MVSIDMFTNKTVSVLINVAADDDDRFFDILDTVINCYIIHIVAAFGVVGNIFNIIVLSCHGMTDTANIILMSLSIVDLLHSITTMIRRLYCLAGYFDRLTGLTLVAWDQVFLSLTNRVIGIISATHIVIISIERTIAVYLPFHISMVFSVKRTKIYLAIAYLFWITIASPYVLSYDFVQVSDITYNRTYYISRLSQFCKDNLDTLQWVNSMIVSNIRGPVFIIAILICSILIGFRLHQASVKRAKMSTTKSGVDLRVVRMLLVVSIVYLCIGVPVHAPYMYFYFNPQDMVVGGELSRLHYALTEYLPDLFYSINASVNFIIYVTMSSKFLKTCWKVIKCQWRNNK